MMYDCTCDYGENPTVYRTRTPRARKQYKCGECSGKIFPGERYEYAFGVWDGLAETHRTCERCYDIRVWVKNNVPCLCIVHGNQDEENELAIGGAYERARNEVIGLWFGFNRRMIKRDRFNRSRRTP